ncbi:hypothetical protein RRF57_005285 [Xylaria bambusicola]|uniref:Uncharacterized protein n=1 Tax=Xylaria bambusicola TaxID=326684 RepID=A0AAN7YXN1_9PEZI
MFLSEAHLAPDEQEPWYIVVKDTTAEQKLQMACGSPEKLTSRGMSQLDILPGDEVAHSGVVRRVGCYFLSIG